MGVQRAEMERKDIVLPDAWKSKSGKGLCRRRDVMDCVRNASVECVSRYWCKKKVFSLQNVHENESK